MVVIDAYQHLRRSGRFAASVLLVSVLQGCQMFGLFQGPPQPDSFKSLHVEAALDVNPDFYGRPSPVVLTVYQLSDAKAFLRADISSLFGVDDLPSNPTWLKQDSFQLRPGERLIRRFVPERDVRLFGVVAEYRDLENAQWRAVEVFQAQSPEALKVNLERARVSIHLIPLQGELSSVQK